MSLCDNSYCRSRQGRRGKHMDATMHCYRSSATHLPRLTFKTFLDIF